jgi:hypothetical protein
MEERRMLKEREKELEEKCEQLAAQIEAIRDRVTSIPETQPEPGACVGSPS